MFGSNRRRKEEKVCACICVFECDIIIIIMDDNNNDDDNDDNKMTANSINNNNEDDDLSPYERKRLERIQRNQQRLKELGLLKDKKTIIVTDTNNKKSEKRIKKPRKTPTRFSRRVRRKLEEEEEAIIAKEEEEDNDDEEEEDNSSEEDDDNDVIGLDYAGLWPQTPEELDDDEFEIYMNLREWRTNRRNDLGGIEAYRICMNRTLCEFVRRKRNDPNWVSVQQCWGLGALKVEDFGSDMLQITESDVNQLHFAVSRNRSERKKIIILEESQSSLEKYLGSLMKKVKEKGSYFSLK